MVVSNRNLLFRWSIFRGYLSFREGTHQKNGELSPWKGIFFLKDINHLPTINLQMKWLFSRGVYIIYTCTWTIQTLFWSEEQNSRDTTEFNKTKLPHDPFCWDFFWWNDQHFFEDQTGHLFVWEMIQLDDEPNHNIKQLVFHQTSIKDWMMISSRYNILYCFPEWHQRIIFKARHMWQLSKEPTNEANIVSTTKPSEYTIQRISIFTHWKPNLYIYKCNKKYQIYIYIYQYKSISTYIYIYTYIFIKNNISKYKHSKGCFTSFIRSNPNAIAATKAWMFYPTLR